MAENNQRDAYIQTILENARKEASTLDPLVTFTGHTRVDSANIKSPLTLTDVEREGIIDIALLYLDYQTKQYQERMRQVGEMAIPGQYEPRALAENRKKISPEIGEQYDAHGIARGTLMDQLVSLDNLLTNGISGDRTLHTAYLRGRAEGQIQEHLYDMGGFIIIGPAGGKIHEDGIVAVLYNEHFAPARPILQARFPKVKFISGNDLPQSLISQHPLVKPSI